MLSLSNTLLGLWMLCLTINNQAQLHPTVIKIDTNTNILSGQIPNPHANTYYEKWLGDFDTWSECLSACLNFTAGATLLAKCKSVVYHEPGFGKTWARGCYARVDDTWNPIKQINVTSAIIAWPCVNDEDCNLNGLCNVKDGKCNCDPQWSGDDCGTLKLLPATKGNGFQRSGYNQWGGNPFFQDNRYWVFAVEMTNGCFIGDYLHNSRIVLASSSDPEGPYKFVREFLPVFTHAAHAFQMIDGTLLVAYEGRNIVPPDKQHKCNDLGDNNPRNISNMKRISSAYSHRRSLLQPTHPECNGIMVAASKSGSVDGPWTHHMVYFPNASTAKHEWDSDMGVDNPSLIVLPSGTSLLGFRTCSGPEYSGVGSASHWSGPFLSVVPGPVFSQINNEDPFIWQDIRGNLHALWHHQANGCHGCGGHSFSRDGIHWKWSSTLPYSAQINWTDNSSTIMKRRERPGLILNKWHTPTHLSTAVMDKGQHTYLHIQPIAQV